MTQFDIFNSPPATPHSRTMKLLSQVSDNLSRLPHWLNVELHLLCGGKKEKPPDMLERFNTTHVHNVVKICLLLRN